METGVGNYDAAVPCQFGMLLRSACYSVVCLGLCYGRFHPGGVLFRACQHTVEVQVVFLDLCHRPRCWVWSAQLLSIEHAKLALPGAAAIRHHMLGGCRISSKLWLRRVLFIFCVSHLGYALVNIFILILMGGLAFVACVLRCVDLYMMFWYCFSNALSDLSLSCLVCLREALLLPYLREEAFWGPAASIPAWGRDLRPCCFHTCVRKRSEVLLFPYLRSGSVLRPCCFHTCVRRRSEACCFHTCVRKRSEALLLPYLYEDAFWGLAASIPVWGSVMRPCCFHTCMP